MKAQISSKFLLISSEERLEKIPISARGTNKLSYIPKTSTCYIKSI